MRTALIVGKNREAHEAVRAALVERYKIEMLDEIPVEPINNPAPEVLFLDIGCFSELSGANASAVTPVFRSFKRGYPQTHIIVLSQVDRLRLAVAAVKAGADDYLSYPIDPTELQYVLENAAATARVELELDYLRDQFWKDDSLELIRTRSECMKRVYQKIKSVAPTRTTVLLTGGTGVGKGVLARLIHRHSDRADNQFISVHCGAIADSLVESELFGHEKGAFTGAHKLKKGKFEIAHTGTIFLDEIATVTPATQIKLLQVLQDRTLQRVGGEEELGVDVRIIAATNQNLKELVNNGTFRSDLFYRLNVFPIDVPSLQERKEDVPLLIDTFLENLNALHGKDIESVHELVLDAFNHYPWPGNIRELENLVERAYILETSNVLSPESFPAELFDQEDSPLQVPLDTSLTLADVRKQGIEDIERRYLKELLARENGKINATAEAAGVTTRQLNKLMHKHGLRKEDFKHQSEAAVQPHH